MATQAGDPTTGAERRKQRAIRICRGLMERTEDRGCTEAEAMNNALMLGEMMKQHDLELTDLVVKDVSDMVWREVYAADDEIGNIIVGIGRLCSCITYTLSGATGVATFKMFGHAPDIEYAVFLYEICAEAADHGFSAWMQTKGNKYSVTNRRDWRRGFAARINERMTQLRRERDEAAAKWAAENSKTGTNLVVLKDQIVQAEYEKVGPKLVWTKAAPVKNKAAYAAGAESGRSVNLGRPLGGPGDPARLT
jgi:hypothetical protein